MVRVPALCSGISSAQWGVPRSFLAESALRHKIQDLFARADEGLFKLVQRRHQDRGFCFMPPIHKVGVEKCCHVFFFLNMRAVSEKPRPEDEHTLMPAVTPPELKSETGTATRHLRTRLSAASHPPVTHYPASFAFTTVTSRSACRCRLAHCRNVFYRHGGNRVQEGASLTLQRLPDLHLFLGNASRNCVDIRTVFAASPAARRGESDGTAAFWQTSAISASRKAPSDTAMARRSLLAPAQHHRAREMRSTKINPYICASVQATLASRARSRTANFIP